MKKVFISMHCFKSDYPKRGNIHMSSIINYGDLNGDKIVYLSKTGIKTESIQKLNSYPFTCLTTDEINWSFLLNAPQDLQYVPELEIGKIIVCKFCNSIEFLVNDNKFNIIFKS